LQKHMNVQAGLKNLEAKAVILCEYITANPNKGSVKPFSTNGI